MRVIYTHPLEFNVAFNQFVENEGAFVTGVFFTSMKSLDGVIFLEVLYPYSLSPTLNLY